MADIGQIQMLQEMGFSKQQALEALGASGNDLTKAIAYLFGEEDTSAGAGTQQSPHVIDPEPNVPQNTVNISNPQEIPEFLGSYAANSAVDDVRHYDVPMSDDSVNHSTESLVSREENFKENISENRRPYYGSDSSSSSSEHNLSNSYSDEGYPENTKTEFTNVPFILNKRRDIRCWVPFLLIFAHSGAFAKPLLESVSDSPFVQEMQRIVYFIQNFQHSTRWYHDTDELASLLEADAPRGTYYDEDMLVNVLEFMMQKAPGLKPVFESMIHSVDEDVRKEMTVLEIESDARSSSLYDSLNELFWLKDFDQLGSIKYTSVAPIVSYQLAADVGSHCVPLKLEEVIYPEIYSDVALDRVRKEIYAIKHAQMDYQSSTRRLMDLNFFEGKRIDAILSQTAGALQESHPKASEDIGNLKNQIEGCRSAQISNQDRAKLDASPQRLSSYEHVILDLPELRPYELLGVIIAETRYFVRASESWIDMEAGVTVDFANVRSTVERCITPHLITLIYVDASKNGKYEIVASTAVVNEEPAAKEQGKDRSLGQDKGSEGSDPCAEINEGSKPDDTKSGKESAIEAHDAAKEATKAAENSHGPTEISVDDILSTQDSCEISKRRKWDAPSSEDSSVSSGQNTIRVNARTVAQFSQDEENLAAKAS